MKLGYARTSTDRDQRLDLQLDALHLAGVDEKFIWSDEGVSGSKASRPQFDEMLRQMREGDEIVTYSLSRISRSTRHALELMEMLEMKGVKLRSLTEGFSTEGAMGKAILTIMSAINTLEVEQLRERTLSGLNAARARGRVGGRPTAIKDAKQHDAIRTMYDAGQTAKSIAESLKVSESTVWRSLQKTTQMTTKIAKSNL